MIPSTINRCFQGAEETCKYWENL